jgi:hypothetical protein
MLHALYFTKSTSGSSWSLSYAETFKLETARQKPCFLPATEGDSAAIIAAFMFNYVSNANKTLQTQIDFRYYLRT